jgi:hypothetical protein
MRIVMEEFHLTVLVPDGLPAAAYAAMRRALDGARFRARLQSAVKNVFGRYPSLARATVKLSR